MCSLLLHHCCLKYTHHFTPLLSAIGENKVNNMKSITWSEEEFIHLPLYHSTSKNYSKFEPLELNRLAFQKRTELGSNNVQVRMLLVKLFLISMFSLPHESSIAIEKT